MEGDNETKLMEGDASIALDKALQKRFALLEKSRIHRSAIIIADNFPDLTYKC